MIPSTRPDRPSSGPPEFRPAFSQRPAAGATPHLREPRPARQMPPLLPEDFMRLSLCLAATLLATPALANDGFGGLSATGLTFGQTDAVALEEEDLFISIDRIAVDYVFRNITSADVTGEVIFPLPPIHVGQVIESQWNLPEDPDRENLVNFTATVEGRNIPISIDRIAVIEPDVTVWMPSAEQYDTPGRDVTAELDRLGLPLSLKGEAVMAALKSLTPDQKTQAMELGLAEFFDIGTDSEFAFPQWSVIVRYHWTQTFPAGQILNIRHTYENRSSGGIFGWAHPPEDYMQPVADQYCIDEGTSRALVKALAQEPVDGETYSTGMSWNIAYVLRTASSWSGPIGRFKLTIDKGDPGNIVSLCADGIKKTGPTTFVMEKTDYTPDRDLHILIVQPLEN
ncbi:MAG: hypothetical protein C0524_00500 [Rhodobacter sp.]|nr:hypothetical protein [Rhodobacter sp.]